MVAVCEWLIAWTPRHWRIARRLLDPRAVFAGAWMQQRVHVFGDARHGPMGLNRFAIFWVEYDSPTDNYHVEGTAYDANGVEHSRWRSVDTVHFAKDGRSMTYLWEGTVTNETLEATDPRRTGFARLTLASENAGRGRVEHVALDVNLEFNLRRITTGWMEREAVDGFEPGQLRDPDVRDQFAVALAKAARTSTGV